MSIKLEAIYSQTPLRRQIARSKRTTRRVKRITSDILDLKFALRLH